MVFVLGGQTWKQLVNKTMWKGRDGQGRKLGKEEMGKEEMVKEDMGKNR